MAFNLQIFPLNKEEQNCIELGKGTSIRIYHTHVCFNMWDYHGFLDDVGVPKVEISPVKLGGFTLTSINCSFCLPLWACDEIIHCTYYPRCSQTTRIFEGKVNIAQPLTLVQSLHQLQTIVAICRPSLIHFVTRQCEDTKLQWCSLIHYIQYVVPCA